MHVWGCPSWCPSLQQQPACLSTSTQQVSVAVQQAVAEEIAHALNKELLGLAAES